MSSDVVKFVQCDRCGAQEKALTVVISLSGSNLNRVPHGSAQRNRLVPDRGTKGVSSRPEEAEVREMIRSPEGGFRARPKRARALAESWLAQGKVIEAARRLHAGLTYAQDPMDVEERIAALGAALAACPADPDEQT